MTPKSLIKAVLKRTGYQLQRVQEDPDPYEDSREIFERVRPYTKTSRARIAALCDAVNYVVDAQIPGSIVECGVWRGGSMMACAIRLLERGSLREIYLYDTYSGMVEPTLRDVRHDGALAVHILERSQRADEKSTWSVVELAAVNHNMLSTGYPEDKLHFIQGRVQDTIPRSAPESIAILRLDTDWYESTQHGLHHLFPRISSGGVLIIDDYGHWQGVRDAVNEYVGSVGMSLFFHKIDYAGRIAIVR